MQRPTKRYIPSTQPYRGLPEFDYPLQDKTVRALRCGSICFNRRL
jgi:putative transposase